MKYGHFDHANSEYVIQTPETPSPWINYISNPRGFCGIISQAGGGFCFHRDPRNRRITKYRYNNVPVDRPGRYIYLRDQDDGRYWSATWQPVQQKPDSYSCRHGQGYTIIRQECNGIESEALFFVPQDADCEVWRLNLTNTGDKPRKLSLIPYCEFTLWSEPESRNIQWSLHLTRCFFEQEMIVYPYIEPHPEFSLTGNENYRGDRPGLAFLATSEAVKEFECGRDRFTGLYRSESNPQAVETGRLSNQVIRGGVACGALHSEIELAPGESRTVVYNLGYAESLAEAKEIASHCLDAANTKVMLQEVRQSWQDYRATLSIDTPDTELSNFVNIWNTYQCKTTFDWSRYISFYENGEGRGMGTRDSSQDTLSVTHVLPDRVKHRIREVLSVCQFETGDFYHQYFPLLRSGMLRGFSDDGVWMPQLVYRYIAETGDVAFLNEVIPYAESDKKDTLYQHLLRNFAYTEANLGPNGLPLILLADWNDTLHLWLGSDKGESTMVASQFVLALNLTATLAEALGKAADAADLRAKAEDMSRRINAVAWDGDWYLRALAEFPIGSRENEKAKIFLNAQTWAVLSGVAEGERAIRCMDSVHEHLATPEGLKVLWPCFDGYDINYGLISRYNPGRKENGIFAHANTWAIIAECILGRGERALEYYRAIAPYTRNENADTLVTEPYVFCQTICSDDSINRGNGANSWLTGTASWMYIAITQHLLGLMPTLEGLRIDPRIPASWDGFKATRLYRGVPVNIACRRGDDKGLFLEGEKLDYPAIMPETAGAAQAAGTPLDVEVVI